MTLASKVLAALETTTDARAALPQPMCLLHAPPPQPMMYLARDLLLAGELAGFAGDGGSFKTTILLHVAGAIAGGYAVLGRYATANAPDHDGRPVLIVSEEDSQDVIANRLDALIAGAGWDRARVLAHFHVLALAGCSLSERRWQTHIHTCAADLGAALVGFDPWADLIPGLDENDNSAVGPIVKWLRTLAEPHGAVPLVVFHVGKGQGEGKRTIDRIRGATRPIHASRQLYFFEDRAGAIGIECLKMTRALRPAPLTVLKAIATTPGNPAMWTSATLRATSASAHAETFVRDHLVRSGGANSTELKAAAKEQHIRNEHVSRAIAELKTSGAIDYDRGEKGARIWHIT